MSDSSDTANINQKSSATSGNSNQQVVSSSSSSLASSLASSTSYHQKQDNNDCRHNNGVQSLNSDQNNSFGNDEDLSSYWSDSNASNTSSRSPSGLMSRGLSLDEDQQEDSTPNQKPNDLNKADKTRSRCNSVRSSNEQQQRPPTGRHVRKRVMANERERERTKSLNQALEILRNRLPCGEAEKRSKIQTLRMAKIYIEFLANFEPNSMNIEDQFNQLHKHLRSKQQHHHHHHQHQRPPVIQIITNDNNTTTSTISDHCRPTSLPAGLATQTRPLNKNYTTEEPKQPDSPLMYEFYKYRQKQTRD